MARFLGDEFTYFSKILNENGEKYYLKSTIDEKKHTILIHLTNLKHSWMGVLNQEQVRTLAKKFPSESKDSFYSHTQRAFSKGNKADTDGKAYAFTCKKLDKERLEFVWKEKVEALNSLKIVGSMELQERSNDEVLSNMMDYTIDEMETLQSANEQKISEIQRINDQLNKALETVKRTVDIKEQLEGDLYRKFVLVLNTKKAELAKLKQQIESYENDHPKTTRNGREIYHDSHSRSPSPMHSTITTTLNDDDDDERSTNKRRRDHMSDINTSEDEEIQGKNQMPSQSITQSKIKVIDNNRDSSLDLGNDQRDYKRSTVSQHHQRRKYITGTNSISTRPIINHATVSSTMRTPSLPDDSLSTDDLLNKI